MQVHTISTTPGACLARIAACAMLLVVAACSSTPDAIVDTEELERMDSGVAIEGSPDGYADRVARSVGELVTEFADSGRRSFIDDAAYEIELFLQSLGFAGARTSYEILGDRRARIVVAAGKQSTIGRILVERNETCPLGRDALRLYVNGPRTGLFGTGDMLFVFERVARAESLVREDLVALGFLDATVQVEHAAPPVAGGPVDVLLRVDSRERYRVVDVSFALDRTADAIPPELDTAIESAIARARDQAKDASGGVPYELRIESALKSGIADALGSGGYPDATVDVSPTVDSANRSVALSVVATPGPYVVLAEVRFEADGRTDDIFLNSRLQLGQGDRFDARKVRDSVRALYRTGLFSQVTPTLEGSGDARSLVIGLVEQSSIEVSVEPGWGSYELGRITVGARDRNLFGTGINASTSATIAVKALRANVSFSDPWFLRKELIGDLRVEFDRREEPSFTRESRGLGAFVTKEWSRANATTLGYRFRRSEARDIEVVNADVLEAQSVLNVSGVVLTQRYDVRDALFAPTSGYYAEATMEVGAEGLGSELEFLRGKLSSAWFTRLSQDDVLGIGLRGGVIAPAFDERTIPLQERFFAGGENSVRSFMESELGPRDAGGEALGGEAFATASIEWRHELGLAFQSAVFLDAGFVEPQADDFFSLGGVKTGVGIGIRYLLPIGPLRVDGAVNPDPRSGEDDWVVHFGIGMPF